MRMRHYIWLAVWMLIVSLPVAAVSTEWGPRQSELGGITLVDRYGNSLPQYFHGGRTYVEGQRDQRYSVRISNFSNSRIKAVCFVDGVNVISGKGKVSSGYSGAGYVLNAGDSLAVEGFRSSMNSVAAFRFSDVFDSYSSRTGRGSENGRIECAFYAEEAPVYIDRDELSWKSREDKAEGKAGAPSAGCEPERTRRQSLGTAYGEDIHSRASYTDFRARSSYPEQIVTIYYDDYDSLKKKGVIRDWDDHPYYKYDRPKIDESEPFCPPPPVQGRTRHFN